MIDRTPAPSMPPKVTASVNMEAITGAVIHLVQHYFWGLYACLALVDGVLIMMGYSTIAVAITAIFTYALHMFYRSTVFEDTLWQAVALIRAALARMVASYALVSLSNYGQHWVPFLVALAIGGHLIWRNWNVLCPLRPLFSEYRRSLGGFLDCLLIAVVAIAWTTNEWVGPLVVELRSGPLVESLIQIYLWAAIVILMAQVQLLAFYHSNQRNTMPITIGQQMYALAGIISWFVGHPEMQDRAAFWVTIMLLMGIFGSHFGRQNQLQSNVKVRDYSGNTSITILVTVLCIWTWVWVYVWNPFTTFQGTFMSTPVNVVLMVLILLRLIELRAADGRQLKQVYAQVASDSLTGCGSRMAMISAMSAEHGWLLILDIEGFQAVNDVYGHSVGDDVLRRMVARMQARLGESGKVYRVGDDEFGVVVFDGAGDVDHIGQMILNCNDDPQIKGLTFSIGSARFAPSSPIEALHHADAALQKVKEHGGGAYLRSTPQMIAQRQRILEIRNALVQEHLSGITLAWQPLFDISVPERPIVGVEALSRWHHPHLGTIWPNEFIPIIEREGFSSDLGVHVTREAMKKVRLWLDQGTPVQISVNISVLQLRDPAGVTALLDVLNADHEAAEWMIIEVTETVSSDRSVVEILNRIRETGARIALDDFGAGAANVWRITALPADVLKIDRNLLRGIPDNPASIAMLRTMVSLGHDVGMQVIVEGIETEEVHEHVAATGAVFGQGWLYGRPIEQGELDLSLSPPTQQLIRREERMLCE